MEWVVATSDTDPYRGICWRGEARDALHAFDQYAEAEGFGPYSYLIDPREPRAISDEEAQGLVCQTADGTPWAIMTNYSVTAMPADRLPKIRHAETCKPGHMRWVEEYPTIPYRECTNCGVEEQAQDHAGFPLAKIDGYVKGRVDWEDTYGDAFPDGIPCLVKVPPLRDMGGEMPEPLMTLETARKVTPLIVGPDGDSLYHWHGDVLIEYVPEEIGGPLAYIVGPNEAVSGLYGIGHGLLWDTVWREPLPGDDDTDGGLSLGPDPDDDEDETVPVPLISTDAQLHARLAPTTTASAVEEDDDDMETTVERIEVHLLTRADMPADIPVEEIANAALDAAFRTIAERLRDDHDYPVSGDFAPDETMYLDAAFQTFVRAMARNHLPPTKRTMTAVFDVSGLTDDEISSLALEVSVQTEASDGYPEEGHPDVPAPDITID